MPKARALIAGASYAPDTLEMISRGFDDAWQRVANNYKSPPAIEAARLKLANIILSLAAEGERDPARLRDRAVSTLCVDEPR